MKREKGNGAVLYVRVSTDEQANGPLNLNNQERRCREFCKQRGWTVVEVFIDPGESARSADRPEFKRMLAFCKSHRREVRYVVVQDLSRFTRNVFDQAQTMADLLSIDILVRSATETSVDETASGKLNASIVGSFNEYFSNSLAERMRSRTRDAALAGRFPWRAPLGYVNIGGKEGPNIKPDEKRAPFIRRAFDLMATGRYRKTDVLKIVTDEGLRTPKGKPLSPQTFQAVLRNSLYAGWVTLPSDEDFKPVRGLHEPITSEETFDRVQAILDGRKPSAAPKRKFNPALPLKCLVKCEVCGTPLTGALCAGRNGKFAYYWCRKSGCRAVKIRAERLEEKFLTFLKGLRPHDEIISKFPKLAAQAWADKLGDSERETKRLEARLVDQKRRKRQLLDSMLDGKVSTDTYNEADEEFRSEIAVTEQELQAINLQQGTQSAFVRFAELHLMDIARAWQIACPESRQRVQNLLFEDGLHYSTEAGILNRSKSSLFSMLQAMSDEKGLLASPRVLGWNELLAIIQRLGSIPGLRR